jgi:hypothetical protein
MKPQVKGSYITYMQHYLDISRSQTMNTTILTYALYALLLLTSLSTASTYYVSVTGNNQGAGTISQPFATIQKAQEVVSPGDTVFIRGGTYKPTQPDIPDGGIHLYKSGTGHSARIYYWAYPGETPVFDFSNLQIRNGDYTHGVVVTGSWLHIKGIEICHVPMNTRSNVGMFVREASDNIFELMRFHHNNGSGTFVNDSKGGGGHLYLNCDSHDNYDPTSHQGEGQNADGFGYHYQTSGKVSTYRGCRAWWNSDDGWDFISQEVPVIIENSWAMGNGWANYGTHRPADGNGNGFKAGSSKTGIRHIIRNSVAWKNRASGFYANHSSGGNDWINNTAYANGTAFNLWASTWDAQGNRTDGVVLTGDKAHYMRNNIGFPNNNKYMEGVNTSHNTWDLQITPRENDFVSVNDPSMTVTGQDLSTIPGALGPRQPNGDLPNIDFLKLSQSSQMIDKGTDVGLIAVNAPDLGAYEFGMGTATYKITRNASPGGYITQTPPGDNVQQGTSVVFTAVALPGWELDTWLGVSANETTNTNVYTVESINSDITIGANFRFIATDSNHYEAENTILHNAIVETDHLGYSGAGYVNFDNTIGSSIQFAVVANTTGTQKITIQYANGATTERPTAVYVNEKMVIAQLPYPPTGAWDTWSTVELELELTKGINTIQLESTTVDGGPNLDLLTIQPEQSVSLQSSMQNKTHTRTPSKTLFAPVKNSETQAPQYSISGEKLPVTANEEHSVKVQRR